jgi:dTDP-glucose 4,6-dehydratase
VAAGLAAVAPQDGRRTRSRHSGIKEINMEVDTTTSDGDRSTHRILVTGGAGAVGSHLVRELRGRGHAVWVLDRDHSHDPQYIRADVGDFRQFQRAFEVSEPEYVYHLAAEFGRWNGEDFYETLWRTNAIGNKHLVRLQEQFGARSIFFSSSEVYGDWHGVMSEDAMDQHEIRQLNDYAMTKWIGELQHINAQAMSNTETVRVRLFNIYGPGEQYSPYRSALCIFLYRALHGMPFTVNVGHSRSWLYVADAVRTLANIVDNFIPGEVYNIADGHEYQMDELARIVQKVVDVPEELITYRESEPFTTHRKAVDTTKAQRDLAHTRGTPIEDGIAATVDWMRAFYADVPRPAEPAAALDPR